MSEVLLGGLLATISASVGFFGTYFLEKKRAEREQRNQREAREHEWNLQHRGDRLELYRRFLADLSAIKASTGVPDWDAWEQAENTMWESEILGSGGIPEKAKTFLLAKVNREHLRNRILAGELRESDPEVQREVEKRGRHLAEAKEQFVNAARRDLGMDDLGQADAAHL